MAFEINKTPENSEIHGLIPQVLRIVEKIIWIAVICLILGLILLGIAQFIQSIGHLSDARTFLLENPGMLNWYKDQENVFLGHIAKSLLDIISGLLFWGFLALLVYFKVIWMQFPFGTEEKYTIGYSTILGETTTTYTTLRIALQLWPIYIWKFYIAERQQDETTLENVTTKDDSTISVKFYFAWMPWLARAAIMRGIRELDANEITGSWKGIIKQYAADVIRQYTSAELIKTPSLIIEGIVRRIATWKNKPLEDSEIKREIMNVVEQANMNKLVDAAKKPEPEILKELRLLVNKLSEQVALILYQSEIDELLIARSGVYAKDWATPDGAANAVEAILTEIASGCRARVREEEIKQEAAMLIAGSGRIINWATASIFKRLTVEIERNPAEIEAAGLIFRQQSLNASREENLRSLLTGLTTFAEAAGISFSEALNVLALMERPQGQEASAKKIILEGGSSTEAALDAAIAKYLSKDS